MDENNSSLLSDVLDFLKSLNNDPNFRSGPERDRLASLIKRCGETLTVQKVFINSLTPPPPEESNTTALLTDILGFLETLRDDPRIDFDFYCDKNQLIKRCEAQR